jgi:mono/diheme cytochrome c family protein
MIATGYILFFALPPGTNKSLSLWGLTRHQWGQIHFWVSVGLLAVLLVHLALHWQWVVAAVAQRLGLARDPQNRHLRSGAITLLVVIAALALFAWIAGVSVRERSDPPYPTGLPGRPGETDSKGTASPPDGARSRIDLWKDVYPIFESSCIRCHGPDRALGHFRVDRRDDYFGASGRAPLVIPGNSAQSPLITIVRGQRADMAMAAAHKLSDSQVGVLRAWIDAGAEWPEKAGAR